MALQVTMSTRATWKSRRPNVQPGARAVAVGLLGVCGVAALLALDALTSRAYRIRTEGALVVTGSGDAASDLLIVFPGHGADGDSIARAFEPIVDPSWTVIVVCFAERGVDDAAILERLLPHVESRAQGKVRVLAGSMGGMVAATFLDGYARSHPGAKPVDLFLDTCPWDRSAVKVPAPVLRLSRWYQGGWISSAVWARVPRAGSGPDLEPDADVDAVRASAERNRRVGTPALFSEASYIDRFRLHRLSHLSDAVGSTTYIRATESHRDALIDVAASIRGWGRVFPDLRTVTLASRAGKWHIPWMERPREVLAVVLGG